MHFFTLAALLPFALGAPVIQPRAAQLIPDSYIIKFKSGTSESTLQGAIRGLGNVKASHVYKASFKGFAAKLSPQLLEKLRKLPEVEYIEQDAIVTTNDLVTQADVPWGLGRISHRELGATSYVYDASAGEGACAYVIDTGVYVNHTEFAGRATWLANFADTDNTDGHGHGTHVAGTIAGTTYGVAKKTKIFAVKVLRANGSGTLAGVVAGIDFVAADSQTRTDCPKGSVANLSLGSSRSTAVNAAAAAAVRAGVFLSVAAGNSDDETFFYSPASEPTVCTVGASDDTDTRAWFSNYGDLVDVFAPGVDVLSSWIGNPTATNIISGTSMAAPHVAGLGAYLLALEGPKTPEALCQQLHDTATLGVLADLPAGTFNGVAFNGVEEAEEAPEA